jgi:hypothetical protein
MENCAKQVRKDAVAKNIDNLRRKGDISVSYNETQDLNLERF